MIDFTLVLVLKGFQVLLGLKKRGLGKGKWNGFGGKVELGESLIQAAIRELQEESGIIVEEFDLTPCGIIKMYFSKGEIPFKIHLFRCYDYKGKITETEEMKPQWFKIDNLPFDQMWKEARIWYPVFLNGIPFQAYFSFDEEGEIIDYTITENQTDLQCAPHKFLSSSSNLK